MTICYRHTIRDVLAFTLYHYPRTPLLMGVYAGGFALATALASAVLPRNGELHMRILVFLAVELGVLAVFVGLALGAVVLSVLFSQNKALLARHTVTFSENGFGIQTSEGRAEYRWRDCLRLAVTRRYLFLYLAQHSALIIPKRALGQVGEIEKLVELCRRKAAPLGVSGIQAELKS